MNFSEPLGDWLKGADGADLSMRNTITHKTVDRIL